MDINMKNNKNSLDTFETVSTIIVNLGTIASWLITLFTAFVLTTQSKPVSIPGFIELGAPYKVIFLLTIFLSYIQVLRRNWIIAKRSISEIERTFGSYLYNSVIKFKRPLVVIGFFIIFGIFTVVIFEAYVVFASVLYFIGGIVLLFYLTADEAKEYRQGLKRKYDDEFQNRWLKRIKKRLYENGFVYTGDFLDMPVDLEEINWALQTYFHYYEFEQDLIFSQRFYEENYNSYQLCELRFRHIPSKLEKIISLNVKGGKND
jgi:hypothetical protein